MYSYVNAISIYLQAAVIHRYNSDCRRTIVSLKTFYPVLYLELSVGSCDSPFETIVVYGL